MPEYSILIVEDDPIISRVLVSIVREGGFNLQTPVNSGEQVVEQVALERPDLVMMDIDLPGIMSGIDAASVLFNIFSIPVVFVTGHDEKTFLNKAIASMPFGFLIKPVNPNILTSTILVSISLAERMKKTTEGVKAGLLSSMQSRINEGIIPVILIDSQSRVIWTNQAAEELLEITGSELYYMDFLEFLKDRPGFSDFVNNYKDLEKGEWSVKLPKSSQNKEHLITGEPIFNLFGDHSGTFISIATGE